MRASSAFRSSTARTMYVTVPSAVISHPKFPLKDFLSRGRERIQVLIVDEELRVHDPSTGREVGRVRVEGDAGLLDLLSRGGLIIVRAPLHAVAEDLLRRRGGSMRVEELDRELRRQGFREGVVPLLTHPRFRLDRDTGRVVLEGPVG